MKPLIEPGEGKRKSPEAAFTMTELAVVILLVGLLVITLLPVRAGSQAKSGSIQCLNNLKQVMQAVLLYTSDNSSFFPPNPDDGNTSPGHNWCGGNAGRSGLDEFNPDLLTNLNTSVIAPYHGTDVSIFRCTADPRSGPYTGSDPFRRGLKVPSARTISMNTAVGTICQGYDTYSSHSGKPTLSVNGPWLDNSHNHRRNNPWRTYGNTSELVAPAPDSLWVVVEEDTFSVNDSTLGFGMNAAQWIDWPGTLHDFGCVIGFTDGHSELHKWKDARTQVVNGNVGLLSVPGSVDWQWLADRTSARAK
jgi:type II secretory pathway pseudopilin PulG